MCSSVGRTEWAVLGRVTQLADQHNQKEGSHNLRTGRPPTECDDTRCCIIKF